jgi:hypothetical protein
VQIAIYLFRGKEHSIKISQFFFMISSNHNKGKKGRTKKLNARQIPHKIFLVLHKISEEIRYLPNQILLWELAFTGG